MPTLNQTYNIRQNNNLKEQRMSYEWELVHPDTTRDELNKAIQHEFPNKFIVTHDAQWGRHSNYSEIKNSDSFVAKGNEAITAWTEMLSYINDRFNIESRENTGFHIHFDTIGFSPKDLSNVITFYWNHNSIINLIMQRSRRENVRHVNSLYYRDVKRIQDLARIHMKRKYDSEAERNAEFWDVLSSSNLRNHYQELSLSPNFRTLEFRRHVFTKDSRKFQNWVLICQNMIKKCKRRKTFTRIYTQHEKTTMLEKWRDEQFVFDYFGKNECSWSIVSQMKGNVYLWRQFAEHCGQNETLRNYFERRCVTLNRAGGIDATRAELINGFSEYIKNHYTNIRSRKYKPAN